MNLFIIRDGAFTLKNGKPASNLLHYEAFGERYLEVFERVYIVGRLFEEEDKTALPIEGNGVSFIRLPGKRGLLGAVSIFWKVLKFAISSSKKGNAYILRVPGTIPSIMFPVLLLKRIPFAVEVAADPYDSYSKRALDGHNLSFLIQHFFAKLVRYQCKKASASVYVTDYSLQKRYPPGNRHSSFSFTSLDLKPSAFAIEAKKIEDFDLVHPHLVLTGNMQGSMKGHDVLIKAFAEVRKKGVNARLTIIGYGNNMDNFQEMCETYGVRDYVFFTGKLPAGDPIRDILKTADIFVLPSRQEGLPRALLEAMSLGLPAIATRVGGVPELIASEAIVPPDSVTELTSKILEFLSAPEKMEYHASLNFEKSQDYSAYRIKQKRNAFLYCLNSLSKG